jgi:hypothetical protein
MVLLISKNSLELATVAFAVKTALLYCLPIILVHDLESCPFPNPFNYDPIFTTSGIFRDKAISFIADYVGACCLQLRKKYRSSQTSFDFCLCYASSLSSEVAENFVTKFDQYHIRTYKLECSTDGKRIQKLLSTVNSVFVLLTEELHGYLSDFIYLLQEVQKQNKRAHFMYPYNQILQLQKIFQTDTPRYNDDVVCLTRVVLTLRLVTHNLIIIWPAF